MSALTFVGYMLSLSLCALGYVKIPDIHLNPVIVGGSRATTEEAPFMASYWFATKGFIPLLPIWYKCGASILSHRFVLSAAHCYVGEEITRSYVTVGADKVGEGQNFDIEKCIPHPHYDEHHDYDVLVIKLVGRLQFSGKVQPISLADSSLVIKKGAYMETFGFGRTESGLSSNYLLKVRVPYTDPKDCQAIYPYFTERMICAGEPGKDACKGDSGGPLVYGHTLVGVVSHGAVACGKGYGSGVYSSVPKLRKFIDSVIRSNS